MISKITYILTGTLRDCVIYIYTILDFLLPDFLLATVLRRYILMIVASVGSGTRIRKGQYLSKPGKLVIGSKCYINRGNTFDVSETITIGDTCSIGYENIFITSSHFEKTDQLPESGFTSYSTPITIGNNVWITSRCTILPGVTIGDDCIIGAGSVVTKDCEPGYIYAGIPARQIRKTAGFVSMAQ